MTTEQLERGEEIISAIKELDSVKDSILDKIFSSCSTSFTGIKDDWLGELRTKLENKVEKTIDKQIKKLQKEFVDL